MLFPRLVAGALAVTAAPLLAVTVTSAPGAPDPGLAAGQTLLVSFDTANVAGVTNVTSGAGITAAGNIGGVRAAPAGTGNGVYQSIGTDGTSTFDFSGWTGGRPLASLSFYWGSIDRYNFVDFLDATGTRIGGLSGADLPRFDGNQGLAMTNRRVFFDFLPTEKITAVRLHSTGNAFEYDSFAGAGAVPEPATWAMLILGFGCVGLAMRRRAITRVSAATA